MVTILTDLWVNLSLVKLILNNSQKITIQPQGGAVSLSLGLGEVKKETNISTTKSNLLRRLKLKQTRN